MRLHTVAMWALLGTIGSSAAALAVPVPSASSAVSTKPPVIDLVPEGTPEALSHFTAGQALTVDGRLGHASIPRGSGGETFLFASVAGGDSQGLTSAPMNLAIVIDRSGSMKGERIANAIAAATGIVDRLRDGDSVTVISFDTNAQVVVPPTTASLSSRASIASAIRSIRLGGDTCISCGLEEAMRALDRTPLGGDRVNRMILLSDGATNHGIKDIPGLRALAGRMRDRGCSISTIGVDVDFDEKVMAAIAVESNGRHHFVANAAALPAVFDEEFDSLLATIARDSELAIDLAPGVEVVEVFDRTFRREGSRIIVPFGTFAAKQEKTVLMRLRVPSDREGSEQVASMTLRYRDLVARNDGACSGDLALRVTSPDDPAGEIDPFVAARIERSRTAQTLTDANLLFQQGRVDEARARLRAQKSELATSESTTRAFADARPSPKPSHARSLDRDFEDQIAAVATAEASFAAPPAAVGGFGGGGGSNAPAPPAAAPQQDTHAGKAAVRTNQSNAVDLAF